MRIANISTSCFGTGSFMVAIGEPETYLNINMTEEESDRIHAVALQIFQSRQADIAEEIRTSAPPMRADFSEVNDDIQF